VRRPTLPDVLRRADEAAARLARADRRVELCAVTCSYDTAFEPVEEQTREKLAQLARVFPADGPVGVSLVVVDDSGDPTFRAACERAFDDAPFARERLAVHAVGAQTPGRWGQRGRATREGLSHALARAPDAILHINLNLKVHAAQAAVGLETMLTHDVAAAIGSRARRDGGDQAGAGVVGRGKSLAFNRLVRGALPALSSFRDIGSPMKVLAPAAARAIVRRSRLDDIAFETEWLTILVASGLPLTRFGILWQQRSGSRPPLEKSLQMLADVQRLRRASRRGAFD
jgi:hypothetical protein